jgi:alcohol dehydrogenase class IV
VVVYDGVLPDPSIAVVQAGLDTYRQADCDSVLALGGGSSIDTAKTIAAAATNGGIANILGLFKVKVPPVPLYAIPTTAGTGSEASYFAVISDTQTHQKNGIGSPAMLPVAVALDPVLMLGLPQHITAATGMDALTHAVETYISTACNEVVRTYSRPAVEQIFRHLPVAYQDGSKLEAREAMTIASYSAGMSLNIAAVGYVHAIAHQLGAKYGTPHGLANAIVMPYVLDMNVDVACGPLAELADTIRVSQPGDTSRQKAERFVAAVRDLSATLGIPTVLDTLQHSDIPELVKLAAEEGRTYAVPRILSRAEITTILQKLLA